MRCIELTGSFFGMLTVVGKSTEKKYVNGESFWECRCCCEKKTKVIASSSKLRKGNLKHCGCVFEENSEKYNEHIKTRLAQRSIKNGECIEWGGFIDERGFGVISARSGNARKLLRCHRAAWIAAYGPIQKGYTVQHTCGNKACMNIHHLHLLKKTVPGGCFTKGTERYNAKITEEDVSYILSQKGKVPSHVLGNRFGISGSSVRAIWKRKSWKHVEIPCDCE